MRHPRLIDIALVERPVSVAGRESAFAISLETWVHQFVLTLVSEETDPVDASKGLLGATLNKGDGEVIATATGMQGGGGDPMRLLLTFTPGSDQVPSDVVVDVVGRSTRLI